MNRRTFLRIASAAAAYFLLPCTSRAASLASRKTEAETYCFARSATLRRNRGASRWAIGRAVEILPEAPPKNADREAWRRKLTAQLQTEARQRYRFSIFIYIILYIVIPIVVRLVIEWFLRHRDE